VILVDTSIWVDHLRRGDERLSALLDERQVVTHPFIVGELALGHLRPRRAILQLLQELPSAAVATEDEVLQLIDQESLFGTGLSYIDAHLIASARLAPGVLIWTRDKHMTHVAAQLQLAASPPKNA